MGEEKSTQPGWRSPFPRSNANLASGAADGRPLTPRPPGTVTTGSVRRYSRSGLNITHAELPCCVVAETYEPEGHVPAKLIRVDH